MPVDVIGMIKRMADQGIIGTSKGAIYRHFIVTGLQATINDDYVRKHIEAREMLHAKKETESPDGGEEAICETEANEEKPSAQRGFLQTPAGGFNIPESRPSNIAAPPTFRVL